jgi:hypothetical protein
MKPKTKTKLTTSDEVEKAAQLRIDARFLRSGDLEDAQNKKREINEINKVVSARALAQPEVQAGVTIQRYNADLLDVNYLIDELKDQINDVRKGDLSRPEAMLVAQVHTLDALFGNLIRRSQNNSSAGYLDAAETYMRLALKAQGQAVRTIEALTELKNPRAVAFVQQANITTGPQQINNGTVAPTRARENENERNKQAKQARQISTDARAQTADGRVNSAVGAVAEFDRPADGYRQSESG